jgi:hypothetical protein
VLDAEEGGDLPLQPGELLALGDDAGVQHVPEGLDEVLIDHEGRPRQRHVVGQDRRAAEYDRELG